MARSGHFDAGVARRGARAARGARERAHAQGGQTGAMQLYSASTAVRARQITSDVVALALLDAGAWSGQGVLGPEAFPARPYLDKLAELGSPHGVLELEP